MQIRLPVTCALLLAALGCNESAPEEASGGSPGLEITVAPLVSQACTTTDNGDGAFPEGVDRLLLRLTGPGGYEHPIDVPKSQEGSDILLTGIPVGEQLTLDLYGCQGTQLQWSGRANDVSIQENEKTGARVYFTRKNQFSCTGHDAASSSAQTAKMQDPRFMHQSVVTNNGRVLLIGGFNQFLTIGPEVKTTDAIDDPVSISEYRPSLGLFREWDAGLAAPRALHHAIPFDNKQKILVVGGVTRAILAPSPPIRPSNGDESLKAEVIDAEAKTVVESDIALAPKPLSAAAWNPNGKGIVVCGGVQGASGEPSDDLQYTNATAEQLAGTGANVLSGEKLSVARAGHTATWFGEDKVLVLGGNFDGMPGNIAELLTAPSFASTVVTFAVEPPAPFGLHQIAHVKTDGCTSTFLVAGGMGLGSVGGKADWKAPSALPATPRLFLLDIDGCAGTGAFTDHSSAVAAAPVRMMRAFHRLTTLDEEQGLFMVSGGYSQSSAPKDTEWCAPEAGGEETGCYLADVALLSVTGDAGALAVSLNDVPGLAFSHSRIGHDVVVLPDGTALATGGLLAINKQNINISDDAEIFNPLRPTEATLCGN